MQHSRPGITLIDQERPVNHKKPIIFCNSADSDSEWKEFCGKKITQIEV